MVFVNDMWVNPSALICSVEVIEKAVKLPRSGEAQETSINTTSLQSAVLVGKSEFDGSRDVRVVLDSAPRIC
jgi:hypothetical protein